MKTRSYLFLIQFKKCLGYDLMKAADEQEMKCYDMNKEKEMPLTRGLP